MVSGHDDDGHDGGPHGDGGEEEPKSRTGRFHVPHRGGTRVEVGEPIHVGGERPWMCAVKLVGRKRDMPEDPDHPEPTQTLLVRTGRGATAEDARRDALAHLTLVYGSPVEPPPSPVILEKPSDPPPPPGRRAADVPTVPPQRDRARARSDASADHDGRLGDRRGWFARLVARLRGV
jgi:hypothetical protein